MSFSRNSKHSAWAELLGGTDSLTTRGSQRPLHAEAVFLGEEGEGLSRLPTRHQVTPEERSVFISADVTNGKEFLSFLKLLDRRIHAERQVHIILDNLSAHKTQAIREWVASRPRIHLHFTPTSSSWLNAVEGWFAQLERRALYPGIFTSVPELKAKLERFIKAHNAESAKPFKWTKPASHILAAVGRPKEALQN